MEQISHHRLFQKQDRNLNPARPGIHRINFIWPLPARNNSGAEIQERLVFSLGSDVSCRKIYYAVQPKVKKGETLELKYLCASRGDISARAHTSPCFVNRLRNMSHHQLPYTRGSLTLSCARRLRAYARSCALLAAAHHIIKYRNGFRVTQPRRCGHTFLDPG